MGETSCAEYSFAEQSLGGQMFPGAQKRPEMRFMHAWLMGARTCA